MNLVTELDLLYDKDKLRQELIDATDWKPRVPKFNKDWVSSTELGEEGLRLKCFIESVLHESVTARMYIQPAGTDVHMHKDIIIKSAVNILLDDDPGPVTFEDGDYYYRCGLLNVHRRHEVKPWRSDRWLLKFGIKKDYDECTKLLARWTILNTSHFSTDTKS